MNYSFSIIEFGLMIFLFFVAGLSVKISSNKWRLLYAAPTFLAITMVLFEEFNKYDICLFIAAAIQLLCLFMEQDKVKQKRMIEIMAEHLTTDTHGVDWVINYFEDEVELENGETND